MRQAFVRGAARVAVIAAIAALVIGVVSASASAATLHGTFTTPTKQGTISYTAVRAIRGGSEGNFVVAGKRYPGSIYAAVGGGIGLAWYYGTSGITAGNALVKLQPDGSYSGPLWFFSRSGSVTDEGTATVTFP